jgi:hypothetical protein
MSNSTTQMDTKDKMNTEKSLIKDFRIYAKQYCLDSKTMVGRFQIPKKTKGTREHINCILHILKLDKSFIEDKPKKTDRGLYHMCRDVMEWVYRTNRDFYITPEASIIREWVHKRVYPYRPYPILLDLETNKEDSDDEIDEEDQPDSDLGVSTTPTDDKPEPQEEDERCISPETKDVPPALKSTATRVTTPVKATLASMETKVARIEALPRIPRMKDSRKDRRAPSTERKRGQEISPDRNGWDKKKKALIDPPLSKKRKRDLPDLANLAKRKRDLPDLVRPTAQDRKRPGTTRRRGARTPTPRARPTEYNTFEMPWNKDNNPNHWLNRLRTLGAYNERCRCTLTGATKAETTTRLYILFPKTETKAFRAFQEMKHYPLDLWDITSTKEPSANQIPVQDHHDCFLLN